MQLIIILLLTRWLKIFRIFDFLKISTLIYFFLKKIAVLLINFVLNRWLLLIGLVFSYKYWFFKGLKLSAICLFSGRYFLIENYIVLQICNLLWNLIIYLIFFNCWGLRCFNFWLLKLLLHACLWLTFLLLEVFLLDY